MSNRGSGLEARFWSKVLRSESCWVWQASCDRLGYGQIRADDGSVLRAHRVAWTLVRGPIPDGLHVLHHCDNRPCVKIEPDTQWPEGHLFLGTHADNMRDMCSKGRLRGAAIPRTHF